MTHNPELDYEFKENRKVFKPQLFVRDSDMANEPYKFFAMTRLSGVRVKGWKDLAIKILLVLAAFIVGGLLLLVVLPWLARQIDPTHLPKNI